MTGEMRDPARRPPLTLSLIVSTAIGVADEGGLDAVTMRRVGERLNASGMALYRHVANRDELIALMIDKVVGEYAYPVPRPEGWRAALAASARQDWRSFFAHPWVLRATASTRPPMGPSMLANMEWALAVFDGLNVSGRERLYLLGSVVSYVHGLAMTWLPAASVSRDGAAGWWRDQLDSAGRERYPRLAELTTDLAGDPSWQEEVDEEFEFGLARVLDGVGAFLADR